MRPLYQADNCWDRFWCTTIFSRDLQSVMSRIRGAFLPSLPAVPRMAPHVIHVALHVRTGDVGLRGLPVRWYFVVAAKIADRHDRYVRVSGSKLGLKFWIHTDFPRLRAAAMPKLGRHEVLVHVCADMPLASGRGTDSQYESAPYQRPLSNTHPLHY